MIHDLPLLVSVDELFFTASNDDNDEEDDDLG
jgi:hypothetical protein